jgi:hypothetical protein
MNPKDPASPGGAPLRIAIADAYERSSALAQYFGRLTEEARRGDDALPTAPALAEIEEALGVLAAIVRDLPRLVMASRERSPEKIDEAAQG